MYALYMSSGKKCRDAILQRRLFSIHCELWDMSQPTQGPSLYQHKLKTIEFAEVTTTST